MKMPNPRLALSCLLLATSPFVFSQPGQVPMGEGPWVFDTYAQDNVGLTVLARGMDQPFGLVFIPGTDSPVNPLGDVLITERTGQVLLFRNGQLQEEPVIDLVPLLSVMQLFDIELHPDFTDNGLVYFTFIKQLPHPDGSDKLWATTALARARWDGNALQDVEEVFEAKAWSDDICGASSRMHFLADGTLLLGASHRCDLEAPQSLGSGIGKVMRLNDDGTIPRDNPFVGVEGALPEIYTWGNRSVMDFTTHPETGEVWELENGPQGGDEVNILKPGANYGWPLATFGRDYDGQPFGPVPWIEGTELPELFWVPSITVAGMTFYTGDKFPEWKNNLFVTSMVVGRIYGTGHLERVVFNENGEQMREQMFNSLKQRIRYVVQGPDDLLYLLTDSSDGALLRMEPLSEEAASQRRGPEAVSVNTPDAPDPINDNPLFAASDCRACHRIDVDLIGPSYQKIANRYSTNEENLAQLSERIIKGGNGAWGEIPMAPHTNIGEDTAREMASIILGLDGE